MTNQEINDIFGVTESYQLPNKLMSILTDPEKRVELFEKFKGEDLSHDLFTQYFQEQHSNRESMMQDFTPPELCDVVIDTLGEFSRCLDVCSGTGGLTVAAWRKNPDAVYYTEELSGRAFPILLFNLALRNVTGFAINKDVLTSKFIKGFKLTKGDSYSELEEIAKEPEFPEFDAVIMNPPYSLRHEWDTKKIDARFEGYGYPPTKASDYAFVLDGLYHMSEGGTLAAVLPHGVLFRGNTEEVIRTALVKNGNMNAVIGLPDKLFLNTQIPVCVLVLRRESKDVFFIDASKEFEKNAKLNRLRSSDVQKIRETLEKRRSVEKYAEVVSFGKLEENRYNLNIPRYVDTFDEPEPIDLDAALNEIGRLNDEIGKTESELLKMLKELRGSAEDMVLVKKSVEVLERKQEKKKDRKEKKKDGYVQTSILDFIG